VKLGYNELGYNELGYNELGYNERGYNELGYNEHSVIKDDLFSPKWSFYCINQPCYITKPGYNEQIQPVPSCSL
jgi:hypothetical protein